MRYVVLPMFVLSVACLGWSVYVAFAVFPGVLGPVTLGLWSVALALQALLVACAID